MRSWTPDNHYKLVALPDEGDAVIVEEYSEQNNGFNKGENVQINFSDGTAVVEIIKNTQTNLIEGLQAETLQPAGFASKDALQLAIPTIQKKTVIAVVRFRVLQILSQEQEAA